MQRLRLILTVLLTACPWCLASSSEPSRPPEATDGWWSQVAQDLQLAEYEITWQDKTAIADLPAAWQAPNRAQGLRAYFAPDGIRVVPREESEPSWEWGLTWARYGRPAGSVFVVPAQAELIPDGNRIEYVRGPLTEWYVNGPRGLEQGFHLTAPPELPGTESDDGGPIAIDMVLKGSLNPIVGPDAQAIEFVSASGVRLIRYDALKVLDATGLALPAHFEGFNDRGLRGVRIVIDDAGATYPLTVDPIITISWIFVGDASGDQTGFSVSTAGDVNGDGYNDVIVGAPGADPGLSNAGRVYVFHGSPSGLGSAPAWVSDGSQIDGGLGGFVATAGDVNGDGISDVLVGAGLHNTALADAGAVFAYHGSLSGLSTAPDWTATGDDLYGHFGDVVSTAGDINADGFADVIVGAPDRDNAGLIDAGAVYVYHGSASGLSATPGWARAGGTADGRYGGSVGSAGDVNGDGFADIIIGAAGYGDFGNEQGQAFVHHGSASGLINPPAWAIGGPTAGGLEFGAAVATAGDVNGDGYADVLVGATGFNAGSQQDAGAVFIYHGSSTGLPVTATNLIQGQQANGRFGSAVGVAGDVNGDGYSDVIIGEERYDFLNVVDVGRFRVYYGSSSGLVNNDFTETRGFQEEGLLGNSVFTAGDVNGDGFSDVIAGEVSYDGAASVHAGRAMVFQGSPRGLAQNAEWQDSVAQEQGEYGYSVATAGDVNGDGFADVIVSAGRFDSGQVDEGKVWLYLGSSLGLNPGPFMSLEADQAEARFGYSVAGAGDVNGDGFSDVVVGAPYYNGVFVDSGAAFVFHGSVFGLTTAMWTFSGESPDAELGTAVSSAGDVNGDGFADVIVGSPLYPTASRGTAYVFGGTPAGLPLDPIWVATTDHDFSGLGHSVGTAGDVNGDGHSDVIVGASAWDGDEINEGKVFVYHGSPSGPSPIANWSVEGNEFAVFFGFSVGSAGDVNGDGYSDAIIGCRECGAIQGAAFVYHGSPSGLSPTANWSDYGTNGSQFGRSAGTAGDVNGDGFADVIVGGPQHLASINDEGIANVYYGSASGLSVAPSWSIAGSEGSEFLGYSVGTAGDVNGDGYADIVVGSPWYNAGALNSGRAQVFYGNRGPSLKPGQRRMDDTGPIANLGLSDALDGFRLSSVGRTTFGRGLITLEWEVKPVGANFDGVGTERGSVFVDTSTGGVDLNEVVDGLDEGPLYHWRARFAYDPATVPWQAHSRWFTVPWNGWEEADVRLPCNDADGDGYGTGSCLSGSEIDCDDSNADTYPGAPEINDGVDNQCPGDAGYGVVDETTGSSGFLNPANKNEYGWPAQPGATLYEAGRSGQPDFSSRCTGIVTAELLWIDTDVPAPGALFHYLNRPIAPNLGSWGQNSSGGERTNVCP